MYKRTLSMTTYILNSGGIRKKPEKARAFFARVCEGLPPAPRILLCCFAQPEERWEAMFAEDANMLPALFPPGVVPEFRCAHVETFQEEVAWADALYIHGGEDARCIDAFRAVGVPEVWNGKVVATNSASTNALADSFWTCDDRVCMQGLGVLPIKCIPHFNSDYGADSPRGPIDWDTAYTELEAYGSPHLPLYALEEGEYIVCEG